MDLTERLRTERGFLLSALQSLLSGPDSAAVEGYLGEYHDLSTRLREQVRQAYRLANGLQYPTEPDTSIVEGDRVRCFAYADSVDTYVEGVVAGLIDAFGRKRYVILVDKRVIGCEPYRVASNETETACVNGTPTLPGITARGVQKLPKFEEQSK